MKQGLRRLSNAEPVVTRAMREAGAAVLCELFGVISSETLAERVYRAMAQEGASRP